MDDCVVGTLTKDGDPIYLRSFVIRFGKDPVAFSATGDADRSRIAFLVDCANREHATGKYHDP